MPGAWNRRCRVPSLEVCEGSWVRCIGAEGDGNPHQDDTLHGERPAAEGKQNGGDHHGQKSPQRVLDGRPVRAVDRGVDIACGVAARPQVFDRILRLQVLGQEIPGVADEQRIVGVSIATIRALPQARQQGVAVPAEGIGKRAAKR
jgi:hypothetical protein